MTLYRYRAVDDQGQPIEDTMEAGSARQVTQRLHERGLTVNAVEELHKERGLFRISKRLTWDDLNLFSEQLVAIARSELPLAPAIKALAADLRNPRLKPVLDRLGQDLERGASLEEAIMNQHTSFPKLYPAIIKAGEATGNLAGVLQLLTNYSSRIVGLRNTLQMALAYPITVIVIAACVISFMLLKVVPVFAEIFHEFGGQLPAPTLFWVRMGDSLQRHWSGIIIGVSVLIIAVQVGRRVLRRTETGRCWLDSIRLHVPMLGHLHYLLALSRFSRTLGVLLASRVPVLESLELAAAASDSPLLQRAAEEAGLQVAGGERIADALAGTGFFGHHFCWLLATGEDRGEADTALESLAIGFDREVASRDKLLSVMASPVLIVILGGIIVSIIVSLYLPIFSLGDVISH